MPHFYIMDKSNHLAHYGHKGQKWGVRNYQNYDGTYTQAGLERYWPNSKHGTRGTATKERGGSRKGPESFKSWEEYEKVTLDLARKSDSKQTAVGLDGKTRTYEIKTVSPHILDRDVRKALDGVHDYDKAVGKLKDLDQVKYFASMLQVDYDKVFDHLFRDMMDNKITDETKSLMQDHVNKFNDMVKICAPSQELWESTFYKPDSDGPWAYTDVLWDAAEGINRQKYHETHMTDDATRGGHTRGGMMTDMAEGISEGVVRLGERITDAARRTGERMVDKASAKDEEKRVKRELASLTRAEYGDPIETKPDAWTRIRSTDLNRQSVVQQLRQDIANGLSTADARKKYFDQMVKATLADRKLVGNKDAERQLREAWSSRTSPYGYSGLSSAARVREERKLDKQRDELQKMRSKVYDENYNIIDPALYKKYKAAKEQYKADKKSINERVSRDVYSDYAASKR